MPVQNKQEIDSCQEYLVNPVRVERVRAKLVDEGTFMRMSDLYRVLGDPTRIKIIHALSLEELCVCDIASLLGVSQSAVSHQLRVLRNMKIVRYRREGRKTYYCLDDDHIRLLFAQGLDHVTERS
ncbi:MAG: ArsR/SmtB family transcription factor [Candidatus Glassbacteria bacterium]